MPVSLQDKATISVLGHCVVELGSNKLLEKDAKIDSPTCGILSSPSSLDESKGSCGPWGCSCYSLDGVLNQCGQDFNLNSFWILLMHEIHEKYDKEICWIPKFHHMHWNGGIISQCDVHVCKS